MQKAVFSKEDGAGPGYVQLALCSEFLKKRKGKNTCIVLEKVKN